MSGLRKYFLVQNIIRGMSSIELTTENNALIDLRGAARRRWRKAVEVLSRHFARYVAMYMRRYENDI